MVVLWQFRHSLHHLAAWRLHHAIEGVILEYAVNGLRLDYTPQGRETRGENSEDLARLD